MTRLRAAQAARGSLISTLITGFGAFLATSAAAVAPAADPPAADPPKFVGQFLQDHCADCHTGEDSEAGFDLESLGRELKDPEARTRWIRVFDRIRDGEMPPQEWGEPDVSEVQHFLEQTGGWIDRYQSEQQRSLGRVRGRRLTNAQLERTLQTLLSIDRPLVPLLPEEPRHHGFVGIADAQPMSHYQLAAHLNVIDTALDAAFERATETGKLHRREYTARELARKNPRQRCRDPEFLHGGAVVWASTMPFYGRMDSTTSNKDAWYRITFEASCLNPPEGQGVWCTVRRGDCISHSPLMTWIGAFEAPREPKTFSFEAWIPKGQKLEIRPNDATLRNAKFRGGQVGAGEGEPQGVPGMSLHSMTLEEIQPGGDAVAARRQLFGDLPVDLDPSGSLMIGDGVERSALVRQLRRFTRRAFRRPLDDATFRPYRLALVQALDNGTRPFEALRSTYRAVLCSPRFLYWMEPAGPLDDHAIASRLSYFLQHGPPDAQLGKLADQGKLQDRSVLLRQAERLLAGSHGERFVERLTAEWLELDQINFTEPDRKRYRDFDVIVQNAMLQETHAFVHQLLASNDPIQQLIDADYTFLNSRLARYYDLPSDDLPSGKASEVTLVRLPEGSHRGGLLAHGSILKVTANGTDTSPVLRGVWICDRVLGTPIPPPPQNVPAIEPDTRGATTIREMLIQHESDPNCAGCHRKIDPPGFALEIFDAAGRFRTEYSNRKSKRRSNGRDIDASGTLSDGRSFEDFTDFRDMVASDPRPMARNFVEKLVTYSTGQSPQFADRDEIDQIVLDSEASEFGMRDLLMATISSPLFLNK